MAELTKSKTLEDLRLEAGLTQAQVAAKVGAAQGAVCSWETGKNQMRPRVIPLLARLFKCTPEAIRAAAQASRDEADARRMEDDGGRVPPPAE